MRALVEGATWAGAAAERLRRYIGWPGRGRGAGAYCMRAGAMKASARGKDVKCTFLDCGL